MKLTTKSRYGLRCMVQLADSSTIQSARDLSEKQAIELKYVESIMSSLVKAKLVKVKRGKSGGYSLAYPDDTISAYDVILALEKQDTIVSKSSYEDQLSRLIRSKLWYQIDNDTKNYLSKISLSDLKKRTAV